MSGIVNGIQADTMVNQMNNKQAVSPGEKQAGFANLLKDAIENVNKTQNISDQQTKDMASGNVDNLHNVMIAGQKASITLETSVQIQRKVIDAYNEIMRMQI